MAEEKLVLNVSEVAQLLGLSRNSAYLACLNGQLPCVKVGKRILIPKASLGRWLNEAATRQKEDGQCH